MRAAKIENGVVEYIWEVPSLDCFEGTALVEVPLSVEIGANYDGVLFANPADTRTYAQKRSSVYPPIGDQLDAIWKGGDAQADMLKQVMAVKAKYPKEVSA